LKPARADKTVQIQDNMGQNCQTACKPGSVPTPKGDGRPFIWDVRRRTPRATNPGNDAETRWPKKSQSRLLPTERRTCCPYSVLLPVGFSLPPLLPGARCALTAPFRPYPQTASPKARVCGRFDFCATFPGVAPARRYLAPCFRGARTFLTKRPQWDAERGRPAVWRADTRRQRSVCQNAPAQASDNSAAFSRMTSTCQRC
jgi:hypothetical protein